MDFTEVETLADDLEVTPIQRAKLLWRLGFPIPVDLATTLMAQGHDVPQLEAHYLI